MRHLNPVYKRELKQAARTRKMLLLLCVYNLLLAGLGLFMFYLSFGAGRRPNESIEYSGILTLYSVMAGMEFIMVLFIIPAGTAGAIAGEREKQTLEILLSSRISPLQVVIGKLAASISMLILLAVSSLPVLSIVFSIGGVRLWDMAQFVVLVVVTAVYLGSIGIFCSVCSKKTTVATVSAYLAMILLTFLLPLLLFFSKILAFLKDYSYFSASQFGRCFSGKQSILLLFNPLTSFAALIQNQSGRGLAATMIDSIGSGGSVLRFLAKHWFPISMIFQTFVASILIGLTAYQLNPMSKKKKMRK